MYKVMKKSVLRIIIIPIIAVLMIACMPMLCLEVHAEDKVIGKLNNTTYTSFNELRKDLKNNYQNQTVVIEMLADWKDSDEDIKIKSGYDEDGYYESYVGKVFDYELTIPKGCNATLYMNGHIFDRRIDTRPNYYSITGDHLACIYMKESASLVIDGGSRKSRNDAAAYRLNEKNELFYSNETFNGGVISGADGSGIYMNDKTSLKMENVTIVGCEAYDYYPDNQNGGGIHMEENCSLNMKDSDIYGCYAENLGGGIYSDADNNSIYMSNCVIEKNTADTNGGGIYIGGEHVTIDGHKDSWITDNYAEIKGGGIYAWDDYVTIKDITVNLNTANKNGGGIYTMEEDILMENVSVIKNTANKRGGGIYIENDENTINDCRIEKNSADELGGGVYVEADVDVDFWLKGSTQIRNNSGSNLYIGDTDCDDTEVEFDLNDSAEVWFTYHDGDHDKIKVSYHSSDYSKYLHSDQDGYYFTYQDGKTVRLRGNANTASVFGAGNMVMVIIIAAAIVIVAMGAIKLSKKH